MVGSPERVDLRSYERQGLDIIPTVHMGPAVTQMERRGIETNIGNLNRDIKAANRLMNAIRKTIGSLRDWIADILEARKEVLAEMKAEQEAASPNLALLLRDYMDLRKAERKDWSRYGQQKGTSDDLKAVWEAICRVRPLPSWSASHGNGDCVPVGLDHGWQSHSTYLWRQSVPGSSP